MEFAGRRPRKSASTACHRCGMSDSPDRDGLVSDAAGLLIPALGQIRHRTARALRHGAFVADRRLPAALARGFAGLPCSDLFDELVHGLPVADNPAICRGGLSRRRDDLPDLRTDPYAGDLSAAG